MSINLFKVVANAGNPSLCSGVIAVSSLRTADVLPVASQERSDDRKYVCGSQAKRFQVGRNPIHSEFQYIHCNFSRDCPLTETWKPLLSFLAHGWRSHAMEFWRHSNGTQSLTHSIPINLFIKVRLNTLLCQLCALSVVWNCLILSDTSKQIVLEPRSVTLFSLNSVIRWSLPSKFLFVASVIPFISAINVISTGNAALVQTSF